MRVSKNIILLGFVSLCNEIASEMVTSVLPVFFSVVLRTGASALGLVEGSADAVANIMRIFSGYATDKSKDKKSLIAIGYFLPIIARPLYAIAGSVSGLFVPRIVDRMGRGIREVPRDIVIADAAEPDHVAFSFSVHRAMDTLGAIIGPLIAFWFLSRNPNAFTELFFIAAVIGVGSLVLLLYINVDKFKVTQFVGHKTYKNRTQKLYAYSGLFLMTASIVPVAVILTFAGSVGIPYADVPLVYLAYSLVFIFMCPFMGGLADRIGESRVLVIGALAAAASYIAFATATTPEGFILALALFGVVPACTEGVVRAFVAEHIGAGHRGMHVAIAYTLIGIGALCAGGLGGYIWEHFGPNTVAVVFGTSAVFGSLCILVARKWRVETV